MLAHGQQHRWELVRPFSAARLAARDVKPALAVLRARWFLRGADVGTRVRLNGRPTVVTRGTLRIRDRVKLISTVATLELVADEGGVLDIGERCFVNFGCSIVAQSRVEIGARTLIGPHCMIMDTGFHRLEPDRRLERPEPQPITIGENVWLGARVIVLPGVTIGRDSVIGIGSVVTHDIPPGSVAVGVPARVVRTFETSHA
jgi:maltose O-acetyltransferase